MDRLRSEPRRADALACFRAALAAVDPERLVREALAQDPWSGSGDSRHWTVAIGKAAPGMIRGAIGALPGRLYGGLGITTPGGSDPRLPAIRWFEGGHPLPDRRSADAGRALERFAADLGSRDRVLGLVSGGGSACLCLPIEGVEVDELAAVTRALAEAGADIRELNAVRRRLDRLKGGGLARFLGTALERVLVLSDVPFDAPGLVASGPFGGDAGALPDPRAVVERYGVLDTLSPPARRAMDVAEGERVESDVRVLADWRTLRDAAAVEASHRGWRVEMAPAPIRGEAREVGRSLGARLRELSAKDVPGRCLVAAGETTVVVRGSGRGGRNQELVLGAATELEGLSDVLVASFATDGVDGASPAAGGFADGTTTSRAHTLGTPVADHLRENDAFPLLERLGDAVTSGPTGTNVLDLMLGFVGAGNPEFSGKVGE